MSNSSDQAKISIKQKKKKERERSVHLPLLCVEDGKHVLAGHEALLHVSDLQIVQGQHVLLLLLLWDQQQC